MKLGVGVRDRFVVVEMVGSYNNNLRGETRSGKWFDTRSNIRLVVVMVWYFVMQTESWWVGILTRCCPL